MPRNAGGRKGHNFSQDTVLAAIEGSAGIMTPVANKLGCDWRTAQKYVNKWAQTRQAFDNEQEKILDMAESVLFRNIKGGDSRDAKWVLSKKGKSRGYGESLEVTGDATRPIGIIGVDYRDALTALTPGPIRNSEASGEDEDPHDGA